MKRKIFIKFAVSAAFIGFIFCGAATTTRAQIQPFVDCIEQRSDGLYAYFGYVSYNSITQNIPATSSSNLMTPVRNPPGQPSSFEPGVHPRAFAFKLNGQTAQTWTLTRYSVTASLATSDYLSCGTDGANTRLTTFQGKLSDGNQTANGAYDLQLQLFDQATDGTARTSPIILEDVPVVNGIFTVQLDLGANSLIYNTGSAVAESRDLNPSVLEGRNSFFEIGVRAGSSTGAYTLLTPRQPLSAVPLAMRANSANNAVFASLAGNAERLGRVAAANFVQTSDGRLSDARTPTPGSANYIQNTTAQQANSNFNISGSGTIGGTLTANQTTTNGFLARNGAPGGFGINNNGYGFQNDNDSGLYSSENGQVSLYVDSVEKARVTNNGLQVFGTLTANTKNFKIDHPLDPRNKTLTYTSVESPDMKNIYDGNIVTDGAGAATVTLPGYFEALNTDFRYQLTVIGTFAQAIILEKIKGNQFKIKTDKPNVEVSWQVTGIRRDKFAEDHRPTVEQEKPAGERGKCLYAPACGNPKP